MATINRIQIQNRPLRIGFPSSNHVVIDYYVECSGVSPGVTQLELKYDITGNDDGVAFSNGETVHTSVITLNGNVAPRVLDTLIFIRRGIPMESDGIFAARIVATLKNPNSPPYQLTAFITC